MANQCEILYVCLRWFPSGECTHYQNDSHVYGDSETCGHVRHSQFGSYCSNKVAILEQLNKELKEVSDA